MIIEDTSMYNMLAFTAYIDKIYSTNYFYYANARPRIVGLGKLYSETFGLHYGTSQEFLGGTFKVLLEKLTSL